jgi:hypothetical protein
MYGITNLKTFVAISAHRYAKGCWTACPSQNNQTGHRNPLHAMEGTASCYS